MISGCSREPLVVRQLNSDLASLSKQQNITGLQITMHYISVVQSAETINYLVENIKYKLRSKQFTLFLLLGDQVLQVRGCIVHYEVENFI